MIRMERFTLKAQEAVAGASRLAQEARAPEVGARHLLAALLEDDSGIVAPLLQKLEVPLDQLRREVNGLVTGGVKTSGRSLEVLPGAELKRVLELAQDEAGTMEATFALYRRAGSTPGGCRKPCRLRLWKLPRCLILPRT